MKTSVRLRRAFTPLTIGSKLVCVSPDSGLSQTYYSKEEMYVPNRATSPLRIAPIVIASADDNSWEGTMGNHYLEEGQTEGADNEGKSHCYKIVQQLLEESKQQNGSIICAEILGLKGYEKAANSSSFFACSMRMLVR